MTNVKPSFLSKVAGSVLATGILATGGAAWTANSTNAAQEARLKNIEVLFMQSQVKQQELIDELVEANRNLAVLAERLANVRTELDDE